ERVAGDAVLRHHPPGRAPDRQSRPPRGGGDRRGQRVAAVLAGHPAPHPADHAGRRALLPDRHPRRLPPHLRPHPGRTLQQHARLRHLRLRDRHARGQARPGGVDLALPLPLPPGGHRAPALVHPADERLTMSVRSGGLRRAATFQVPLGLLLGATLFPFYWMVITSIRPHTELYSVQANPFLTLRPTMHHFQDLFERTMFARWAWNTLFIATVSTALSLFCGLLAGYALARLKFRWASPLGTLIFITYLVPP